MRLAYINLKNDRGYTPLQISAMRREPAVIVSLLTKGTSASETTGDGQCVVSICRRLIQTKYYHAKIEQGQESNKDRFCINILEREIRRNPVAWYKAVASPLLAGDLHMKLLYLENRFSFARLFFPSEWKLHKLKQPQNLYWAFCSRSASNLREVDLNENRSTKNKRLYCRVEALMETGIVFFLEMTHCFISFFFFFFINFCHFFSYHAKLSVYRHLLSVNS
ncbi:BTB/POZ domain and ankyrin repeat-containing protein NPR2-like [Dendrobium catenatum]|uniref:BTB/POZ domain and ankyrin repeat-containing protein NPR2-like n=1 Tax=Dendrobium catenatum TaxID=906689 RepID=UPI00109FB2EC|nr:BTB/POZ domain and ankyrin repeat-containing protein NPR2-like [Dendrobium catenatum]